MLVTRNRSVALVSILIVCVLTAAMWRAAADRQPAWSPSGNQRIDRARSSITPTPEAPVATDETARLRSSEAFNKLPLGFEINQGQTQADVKFLSHGAGYNLFLTASEAVLSLTQNRPAGARNRAEKGPGRGTSDVLRMRLAGSNPAPVVVASDPLPGKSNYFIGKNPEKWRVNVPTFATVTYRQIYAGVDVVYYGNQRKLENDFIVAPGTNPGVIAIAFAGANQMSIDEQGDLVLGLRSGNGDVRLQKPVIYQLTAGARREVAGHYVIRNRHEVGFAVGNYDPGAPLVIDPVLVYSSYLGGNGGESGNAIAVDDLGNAYITGDTGSTTFPTVAAIDSVRSGTSDAFVSKVNASGSALIYSTYLGGSGTETGMDIAADGLGNAYLTGRTTSSDFPRVNAFDNTYSGGLDEDAFVTRINATGSTLIYSTYLSGNFGARGWGIAAVGVTGFAYVTGTATAGFPVTAGAFDSFNFNSGFLTKLCTNCTGASSLVYSTFLAHNGTAEGRAVAADTAGNAYVTGNLNSTATNFASFGAFQTNFGGGTQDAFVEKFDTTLAGGTSRVYATYLGGLAKDIGGSDGALNSGRAIAIDGLGNVYLTGATTSTNFPIANASQAFNAGQTDVFLTKLNTTGSALIYSTYLGGDGDDFGRSVAVNIAGGAYVAGVAGPNFPTIAQLATPVPGAGFVTKFTQSGTPIYSTLLSGVTGGCFGIALDGAGNAFVTGNTSGTIVTVNPFQANNGGVGTDGFVSVIADPTIIGRVSDENGNPLAGATVNLTGVPSATTTTDANGGYTFGLLTFGNDYIVSVVASGFIFNSAAVVNLVKNARRDFGPVTNSVAGQVTLDGTGLSGVTMTLSGGKALVTQTDTNGFYGFSSLPSGRNYVVTPSRSGFSFEPTSRSVDNLMVDQTFNFLSIVNFQFSLANQTVNEGAERATITVMRGSGTTGPASVDYATADESANQTMDYTITIGTLNFATGETSKSFEVPIIDDLYVEGPETFSVTLSNPVGAILGTPNPAQVMISDNDSAPPTTNPLDNADARFFVRQHYLDFLSRVPDQSGFDFWAGQITQCGANQTCINNKRIDVSNAFFFELEYQQTAAFVFRLYRAAFGNNQPFPNPDNSNPTEAHKIPNYAAFSRDRARLIGSANLAQDQLALANLFSGRPEFLSKYSAGLTLDQFVDAVLLTIMSDDGVDLTSQRTALIALGSRGAVMYRLADDNLPTNPINNRPFIDAEYNRSLVASQYFGYLRRDADIGGFLFWLGQLNSAPLRDLSRQHAMVCAFITSAEYQLRFSSVVTHTNAECQ